MRQLILLVLIATGSCSAAEPEVVTMRDGRVLTGEVNQTGLHAARIALISPKGAVVSINLDEVLERNAYTPPIAPEAKPAPASVLPPAEAAAHKTPPAIAEYQRRITEYAAARKAMEDAAKVLDESRGPALSAWLATAGAEPFTLMITEKSTQAQIDEANARGYANRAVAKAAACYGPHPTRRPSNPSEAAERIGEIPWKYIGKERNDPLCDIFLTEGFLRR